MRRPNQEHMNTAIHCTLQKRCTWLTLVIQDAVTFCSYWNPKLTGLLPRPSIYKLGARRGTVGEKTTNF